MNSSPIIEKVNRVNALKDSIKVKIIITTKLLSLGLEVRLIPNLIFSLRSDTLFRDIFPWKSRGKILQNVGTIHLNIEVSNGWYDT